MDLLQRVETLEGESQVRRLMARYMDLCDVPRAATNVRELAELFTVDAVWEGIGTSTAQTFGQHRGATRWRRLSAATCHRRNTLR